MSSFSLFLSLLTFSVNDNLSLKFPCDKSGKKQIKVFISSLDKSEEALIYSEPSFSSLEKHIIIISLS